MNQHPVSCRVVNQLRGLYGWPSGDRIVECHSCAVRRVRELDIRAACKKTTPSTYKTFNNGTRPDNVVVEQVIPG